MIPFESPFLAVPVGDWLCSNELAFAIFDGFPVSPGHVLVTTRRIVETWFDASDEEQAALMGLVKEAKRLLDLRLSPKPDGYNVGFNSGAASGQTVPHVHIHVSARSLILSPLETENSPLKAGQRLGGWSVAGVTGLDH